MLVAILLFLATIIVIEIVDLTISSLWRNYGRRFGHTPFSKINWKYIVAILALIALLPPVPIEFFLKGFAIGAVWSGISSAAAQNCARSRINASSWYRINVYVILLAIVAGLAVLFFLLTRINIHTTDYLILLYFVPIAVSLITLAISEPECIVAINPVGITLMMYILFWIPFALLLSPLSKMPHAWGALLCGLLLGGIVIGVRTRALFHCQD